jgi:two-component system NtrC family sensor kinase
VTTILLTALGVVALAAAWWLGTQWARARAAKHAEPALAEARSELTRRLNELFSLQELAYVLSDSIHLDRIADQVAKYVERFVPCDGAAVVMAGDPPERLQVLAAEGSLAPSVGTETTLLQDAGLVGAAMDEETLQIVEREDDQRTVLFKDVTARQAVTVPLRAHGMTVGALAVVKDGPEPFAPADLRLLSTVATHSAMALANARFFSLVHSGKLQWETTFDALADGVAVVDESGRIRRANRALAILLRTKLPDLIGLDLSSALLGDDSSELQELFELARSEQPSPPLTTRSATLNRTLRIGASPISATVAPGWVATLIEDVTEQKELEGQLIQSEKMAAVGQLVSGVAHELNNPLTSIAGLSEFLLQRPAPSQGDREHVRVIHEQAERAAQIVRDLLLFARKGPTEVAEVDLNDVTQRALSLISYEVRLRKVEVTTDFAAGLPRVRGDRHQIQQVVLNLLNNAVQAVAALPPEQERHVRVSTNQDDGFAVLRVADSGRGIPDELLPRIFDPFVTTKEPGQGTGLGLSITYRIVEDHGGRIAVERAPEGGALFVVTLPLEPGEEPASPPAETAPAAVDAGRTASGRHILLVDEDPAVRRMIGVLFAQDGQNVEAARDAGHALRLLGKQQWDLVLADARAAVSAGESFAEVLCARHPDLKARTIFLTADVRPETEAWLGDLGCRFFRKPFNVRELRAAAAEILG